MLISDAQLTGVPGYPGARIVVRLLKEGYRVRG